MNIVCHRCVVHYLFIGIKMIMFQHLARRHGETSLQKKKNVVKASLKYPAKIHPSLCNSLAFRVTDDDENSKDRN